ncbi:MAG: DDE-type integrase/transposase/recombinase [Roseibium sp.]|uniref:DDE-type integrase/transposase/recombinase n=1 Tax=Roseibium sp. TaxID=1936156 RepID=UPI0026342E53|nr:DDE-type integrase/transposase/recombinase [Roseibium sp.]MCV0428299.1 DDE-type integrase/transposase/recombinase [Roseibium sp.]
MKLWLTAQEIADLQLDGLPSSRYGIQKLAEREAWVESDLARKREGREGGGGLEFHIDLLPLPQRLQYAGTFVRVEREDYRTETSNELSRRECSVRDARLIVLKVAERFRKTNSMGAKASDYLFAQLFDDGKVPLPEWVLEQIKTVSMRTLARWRKDMKQDINRLAYDPSKSRKGTGVLDQAEGGRVRSYCLAVYASNQFLSTKHIRNTALAEFGHTITIGDRQVPMPPLRTFQNALKGWKAEYRNELLKITDPDAYKSKVRMVATGATRADRFNELWQIDASPSDVMTTEGRRNLYMLTEIYSRSVLLLFTKTPRSEAVAMMIRKGILTWGVPELIKTDNGSDFKSRATIRLLDALGIEQEFSAAYSPEQKGSVERVIGTFQRDCAATLPGFVGHSVTDRKKIEARKAFSARLGTDDAVLFQVDLTPQDLQEEADRWANEQYAHTPHESLKRKTPFDVMNAWAGDVRAISDPASLDVLLAPVAGKDGLRKVTKQGVKVDGEYYVAFGVMPDTQVFCRQDPQDLGRLWLFEPDGETYLGEALCPDLAGLDPAETIAKARAMQKALEEERFADVKREKKKITPRTVMEAQRAAYQHNADIVSFPKQQREHETSKTLAASEVRKRRAPRDLNEREAEIMAGLKGSQSSPAPKSAATVHQLSGLETPEARFNRAQQFEQRLADGTSLSDDDAIWLANYKSGPEYRAHKMVWEDRQQRSNSVKPAS